MIANAARRKFIFGGSAALSVAALSSFGICRQRDVQLAKLERLQVALLDIPFPERISSIRRSEDLVADLQGDSTIMSALEISCPATRRAILREYSREEFKTGKYCVADRIVVSRSEQLIASYFGSMAHLKT